MLATDLWSMLSVSPVWSPAWGRRCLDCSGCSGRPDCPVVPSVLAVLTKPTVSILSLQLNICHSSDCSKTRRLTPSLLATKRTVSAADMCALFNGRSGPRKQWPVCSGGLVVLRSAPRTFPRFPHLPSRPLWLVSTGAWPVGGAYQASGGSRRRRRRNGLAAGPPRSSSANRWHIFFLKNKSMNLEIQLCTL